MITNSLESSGYTNDVVFIVVAILVAVVLLAGIVAGTYLIRTKLKIKKNENTPIATTFHDVENNARTDHENEAPPQLTSQNEQENITMNLINPLTILPTMNVINSRKPNPHSN